MSLWAPPIEGEVRFDGTLRPGNAGFVPGPALGEPSSSYGIEAERGVQVGANLFHSFLRFDLAPGERATFLAPAVPLEASIDRILARVTGGQSSFIRGEIRSELPGADLFLINPDGITFGEGASVSLSGSLYATTADRVGLADGGAFDARAPSASLLTMAPPSAFGFLADAPRPITVDRAFLEVPFRNRTGGNRSDAELALVAGGIDVAGAGASARSLAGLSAVDGRVLLVSVASPGEVQLRPEGPELDGFRALGPVALREDALIASTGLSPSAPAPDVSIGPLLPPPGVEVAGRAELGGLTYYARIDRKEPFQGGAGDVFIRGGRLVVDDANIRAFTGSEMDGGRIDVAVEGDVVLRRTEARTTGFFAGTGLRRATGSVSTFVSVPRPGQSPMTVRLTIPIVTTYLGRGDAGEIIVRGARIELLGGSTLDSETLTAGSGGAIQVVASESVKLSGRTPQGLLGGIFSDSFDDGAAGSISVSAPRVEITEGAQIGVQSRGRGAGGDIAVGARDLLLLQRRGSITAKSEGAGDAGNIRIGGAVVGPIGNPGTSGAARAILLQDASISSESLQASGGNIEMSATDLVDLLRSAVTTSVKGGVGDGGNIVIDPEFVIVDRSRIIAQAEAGNGGNIRIRARLLLVSPDSEIDASSRFGVDGTVQIDAPNANLAPGLEGLPAGPLDASAMLQSRCAARSQKEAPSTFVVAFPRTGAASPDDPLGAVLFLPPEAADQAVQANASPALSLASLDCRNSGGMDGPAAAVGDE